MLKFIVLAIALTCVAAKPALLYNAPTLYSAPLAAAPLTSPLTAAYYSAPLTYATNYRPITYASPYAYSAYNTYNYRTPLTYPALPGAQLF